MELFVSPDGKDEAQGTREAPFATLERARDAIRGLKKDTGLPAGGVTVWLRGGDYVLEDTFALGKEDSGKKSAPIVYRAAEGENVRLLGGRVVTGWEPVRDAAVLERLSAEARAHVVQLDLAAQGVRDFGRLQSRGFGRRGKTAHLELFFGGEPMTVARWPNAKPAAPPKADADAAPDDGFVRISGVPDAAKQKDAHGGEVGDLKAGFFYEGDRPKRWKDRKNVWVHGYWSWDWANSYERVKSINTRTGLIKTNYPYGNYAFRVGQRFYFLNVLEELDSPGEYYVDTEAGVLYFWPPAPADSAEALVSVLESPMVALKTVSHVTLRGLTFEATRGLAVRIKGGAHCLVAGCTLRNIGTTAVVINKGKGHGVVACDVSNVGESGIQMTGGDKQKLIPCGHFARNNKMWRFSRWSRTYCPAVQFTGVGFHVAHNHIYDAPHTGILFLANESVIELNHIHHVTLETGDCGAIYTGRDWTSRGNVIRHNYIHDTGGYGMGSMGVYLDDCVSGQTIYGNVFARATRAAFIGGGREVTIENNIFVDCVPAVHLDARGLDDSQVWHNMVYKTMKERLDNVHHHEPPYSEKYPVLQELDKYYAENDGVPPENNVIARNISVGGRWMNVRWHAEDKHLEIGENLVDADPHFVNADADDFRLKDDSPAWRMGFEPIPFDKIGLVQDEYRRDL